MNDQFPFWINPPSYLIRQTEIFRKWRTLMLEHTIQNPPLFLKHLSPSEIRQALETAFDTVTSTDVKLTSFTLQARIYERHLELIGWSYFVMLGQELNNLQGKLSKREFEGLLREIDVNSMEAELSMLVAQQETCAH